MYFRERQTIGENSEMNEAAFGVLTTDGADGVPRFLTESSVERRRIRDFPDVCGSLPRDAG
jgi:hypothetical protein